MSESLWGAKDQAARLAELTASTDDRAKEHPLRRDVRSLGTLLGRVLVEQTGEPLFQTVERLRRLLIQARGVLSGTSGSDLQNAEMSQAREIIAALNVQDAYKITKAFLSTSNLPILRRPIIASAAGAQQSCIRAIHRCPALFVAPYCECATQAQTESRRCRRYDR